MDAHTTMIGRDLQQVEESWHRGWPINGLCAEGTSPEHMESARGVNVAQEIGAVLMDMAVEAEANVGLTE